jgi:hypothetical protein
LGITAAFDTIVTFVIPLMSPDVSWCQGQWCGAKNTFWISVYFNKHAFKILLDVGVVYKVCCTE